MSSVEGRDAETVQERIDRWRALQLNGMDFNSSLVKIPAFHNPNIASKMLELLGVVEDGSFLEPLDDSFDYIAEALRQKNDWEKSEKEGLSKRQKSQHDRFYSQDSK